MILRFFHILWHKGNQNISSMDKRSAHTRFKFSCLLSRYTQFNICIILQAKLYMVLPVRLKAN